MNWLTTQMGAHKLQECPRPKQQPRQTREWSNTNLGASLWFEPRTSQTQDYKNHTPRPKPQIPAHPPLIFWLS